MADNGDLLREVTAIRKGRTACLRTIERFKESRNRTIEDCDAVLSTIDQYVETVASPVLNAFNQKFEKLSPELDKALSAYQSTTQTAIDKKMLHAGFKNEAPDPKLNALLHPFYVNTLSPKLMLEKEIDALKKIRHDIAGYREKLDS